VNEDSDRVSSTRCIHEVDLTSAEEREVKRIAVLRMMAVVCSCPLHFPLEGVGSTIAHGF
jgi:hypothetical protein